ncbi:MAG: N-acetylmuramoyl-L-alanine amidase [Gammaproteobacteria bacterium]|nr:N-acetylmuramoyl-L-alanine amidase [Gammaproteobacteria bacterium]
MRTALGVLLLGCLSGQVSAAPVSVQNIRIWAAPDSTRVVFDLSGPATHEVTVAEDPARVVMDIQDAAVGGAPAQPEDHDLFIRHVNAVPFDLGARFVLELKQPAVAKSFQLGPNQHYGHRLVLDLTDAAVDTAPQPQPQEEVAATDQRRDVVIAVDAGHGGDDPGARGPRGTWEKQITLQMARSLAVRINAERGMQAILTREGDYFLPLRKRMELARRHRADLFISIHADAFRDRRVQGSSVYVLSERGASSEHARWLAEQENASDLVGGVSLDTEDNVLASVLLDLSQTASLEASIDVAERVLQSLRKIGRLHNRRVESAGFAVLKSPDIPSILVEAAYISNPDEEVKLRSPLHQQKVAEAILSGLRGYFTVRAPEGTTLAAIRRHVIGRGDTLSGIAQQYRISMQTLRDANNLHTDQIRIGQVLAIPATDG